MFVQDTKTIQQLMLISDIHMKQPPVHREARKRKKRRKKREQKFRLHVDFILAIYIIFDEVGNDLLHCIFIVVLPDAIVETNRHIYTTSPGNSMAGCV